MRFIVDRIEGDFAVCEAEDKSIVDIPLSQIPARIKEGTNLCFENGKYEIISNDQDRKKRIQNMMGDLWD